MMCTKQNHYPWLVICAVGNKYTMSLHITLMCLFYFATISTSPFKIDITMITCSLKQMSVIILLLY